MKKILLTNNSKFIDLLSGEYDKIYTDSPYLVECYGDAIFLDTLLDNDFEETIRYIRNQGYEINKEIINLFFPKYKKRNIDILNIKIDFTNIFTNIIKLFKLIELHSKDEITIAITNDELYNINSPDIFEGITNRFSNFYYWIADFIKIKNVNLVCKNINNINTPLGHFAVNSWFLRLADLDKKVLLFNLLKKLKLVSKNKTNIYLYKKSYVIREIEPYLHDLGFNLISMPEINFNFHIEDNLNGYEKIHEILNKFFDDNHLYRTFKLVIFDMYKKRIQYYSKKEIFTEEYISKLDKSIKFIITNTISGFDSHIFAKQLQESGYKIINVMHGLTSNFLDKINFDFYECEAPDITLCFNKSEKDMYEKLVPNTILHPISMVQEAKKKRLKFVKRFFANKILKIKDEINIFYPSIIYPLNNVSIYGFKMSDKWSYEFEKKMISLLSDVNKRAIYKNYPMRSYVDPNSLIEYAKSFDNIKVINENFDFRYVSSLGDIFILGSIGFSSTLTWMLGENKPIIYLDTSKSRKVNKKGREILEKSLIVVNIDDDEWENSLKKILNTPYSELLKIWKDKQIYRDQYDEEWFMGTNLHCGKLGSEHIKRFVSENKKV